MATGKYQDDIDFFSALLSGEIEIQDGGEVVETGKVATAPVIEEKEEKVAETFRGKYEAGSAFRFEGKWYVVDENDYISARDAYHADDINDIQLKVGWNTVAHLATSESDLALVAAQQEEEARKDREYLEKAERLRMRLVEEATARMVADYAIGTRVKNRNNYKIVGRIVAHHETEPKVSVQWDGEEQPARTWDEAKVKWFGLNDVKVLSGKKSHGSR